MDFGDLLKHLRSWHRTIGLTAVIFVLLFTISGLLLNHTSELALQEKRLPTMLIEALYGAEQIEPQASFDAGSQTISQWGEAIFLDDLEIAACQYGLQGAAWHGSLQSRFLLVLCGQEILVLSASMELVEVLGAEHGLPEQMVRMGSSRFEGASQVLIGSIAGELSLSRDLMDPLTEAADLAKPDTVVAWSAPNELDARFQSSISARQLSTDLNFERLLLDLHSGRAFGFGGVVFVDLMALLICSLAMSGVVMWMRR